MKKTKLISLAFFALIGCVAASCSKDDDEAIKFKDVTIPAGSTLDMSEGKNLTWTSTNDYIATISDGTIDAKRVGDVTMKSSQGSFKVEVTPKYNYYTEPYLNFGASKESVKQVMKDFTLVKETDTALVYEGTGYTTLIMYTFENEALETSCIMTGSAYSSLLANWTVERYIYVTTSDNYIGMISVDKKTAIVISPDVINKKAYYFVIYASASNDSTRGRSGIKLSAFEQLMKDYSSTVDTVF